MIKSKAKLPDKLSELIIVALEDLAKVKNDERYRISLGEWHLPEDGVCSVCFAGAVIAGRCAPDSTKKTIWPDSFGRSIELKLEALNDIRLGSLISALRCMDISVPSDVHAAPEIDPVYDEDLNRPAKYQTFQDQMRATSKWLAERGL
jgi:hypothetical protein